MRPTRIFSALFAFFALAGPVRAQPVVTSVSGPLTHDGTLTINGSAFRVKTPPEPLVWDDGQADVPLDTYYDETLPTTAQQGPEYNMAYRVASYRGIGSPDGRIQYILGGAHATDNYSGMYFSGNNVSIGRNLRSFQYFAQYWYRVDPLYDEANHPSLGENLKELCLSGAENEVYGGMWGYYAWCGSHVPDRNYTGPVRLSRGPVDCPSLPYACSSDEYVVTHASPINGWIKMQWEGDYDPVHDNPTVVFTTYPDGQVTAQSHYGTAITTYEIQWGCGYPNDGELRFLGIGGFSRVPRTDNGTNSFRYFAGVYIDDTQARVMLGDNADYASCTRMEPQIPSAWADGSITVNVNLGSFADSGLGHIFVFDADNNHNDPGYLVTIGTGPECSDGLDNDGDGQTDHPNDTGCDSPDDVDETDCGDGACEGGETCSDCEPDCGVCPACSDGDSDGYGDPASDQCAHPELDCNDGDENVNPGATEICGDLVDNDCDGLTDSQDDCTASSDGGSDGCGCRSASTDLIPWLLLLILALAWAGGRMGRSRR